MSENDLIWASDYLHDVNKISYIEPTSLDEGCDVLHLGRLKSRHPTDGARLPRFAFLHKNRKIPADWAFHLGGGFFGVRDEGIDLLCNFDLGAPAEEGPGKDRIEFHPLTVYDHTREKALLHMHIMHVAVRKPTLDLERNKQRVRLHSDGTTGTYSNLGEARLVVKRSALDGPDLWGADNLTSVLFFSDRLKRAMEASGGFKRCEFSLCEFED
ncbi:MAG: hypothetical protein AAF322_04910 [Pseudomonadota bacterium]